MKSMSGIKKARELKTNMLKETTTYFESDKNQTYIFKKWSGLHIICHNYILNFEVKII